MDTSAYLDEHELDLNESDYALEMEGQQIELPSVSAVGQIAANLIIGALNHKFPPMLPMWMAASTLCARYGITLGIGPSASGSAIAGPVLGGGGASFGWGIVLLPKYWEFGIYVTGGVARKTGSLNLGGTLALAVTGVKGDIRTFKGSSKAVGIGASIPLLELGIPANFALSVKGIWTSDFQKRVGLAGEVGLSSLGPPGWEAFIEATHTWATPSEELEFEKPDQVIVPKSIEHAQQILAKRYSESKVRRILKKLGDDK